MLPPADQTLSAALTPWERECTSFLGGGIVSQKGGKWYGDGNVVGYEVPQVPSHAKEGSDLGHGRRCDQLRDDIEFRSGRSQTVTIEHHSWVSAHYIYFARLTNNPTLWNL